MAVSLRVSRESFRQISSHMVTNWTRCRFWHLSLRTHGNPGHVCAAAWRAQLGDLDGVAAHGVGGDGDALHHRPPHPFLDGALEVGDAPRGSPLTQVR